jgi:hypothetical protein
MIRNSLFLIGLVFGGHILFAQEIIPFPDLNEHYQHSKNGGRSLDDRNYAIFSEDYQKALAVLDQETDQLIELRKNETDQEQIDRYNEQIEVIRKKKLALLSEAELVDDLQKFY